MNTIFDSKKIRSKITINEVIQQTGKILPSREELSTIDYGGTGYAEDIYIYTTYPGQGGYHNIDYRDDCFEFDKEHWDNDDWRHDNGNHGWKDDEFRNVRFDQDDLYIYNGGYGYDPYGYGSPDPYGYAYGNPDPYYGGPGYEPMRGYGYVPGRGWI